MRIIDRHIHINHFLRSSEQAVGRLKRMLTRQ